MQSALQVKDSPTYLTTEELSTRIKYDSRTIRDRLKDIAIVQLTQDSALIRMALRWPVQSATVQRKPTFIFCSLLLRIGMNR
jgi:hypothetical protein